MRAAVIALALVVCAGCESDIEVNPGVVEWMEWPGEVLANTSFTVRLVIADPRCDPVDFRPRVFADESAVTFSPFFIIDRQRICPARTPAFFPPTGMIVVGARETVGIAPARRTSFDRVFDIRGASSVYSAYASDGEAPPGQPVRTFGSFMVRTAAPDQSRRMAAGFVGKFVDSLGCVRILPIGVYHLDAAYVLEDQADTAGLKGAFVRGYIHQPAGPVCGESRRVFHLLARN